MLRETRTKRFTNRRGSPLQCCRVVKVFMGTTSWGTVSAACGARVALSDAELDNDKLLRKRSLERCHGSRRITAP